VHTEITQLKGITTFYWFVYDQASSGHYNEP